MERDMKLADWIGKTIQHAEIKGEYYLIHFTDGSLVKMRAYIHRAEDGVTFYDSADINMKYSMGQ